MKLQRKLIGENVYLSPLSTDMAEVCSRWFNDCELNDNLGTTFYQNNEVSEREWIEKQLKEQTHQYAIVRKADDEPVGIIGIEEISQIMQTAEIGLFIGDEANRGKGIGSEAIRLLLRYSFNALNLNNIMLCVYPFNERAMKTYEKIGFKVIGRRREALFAKGKRHDIIMMDILREEFN